MITSQLIFTSHHYITPLLHKVKPAKFTWKLCIAADKPFLRFSYRIYLAETITAVT